MERFGVDGVMRRVTTKGLVQPIPLISKESLKSTAVTASLLTLSALVRCLTALSPQASLLLLKRQPRRHPSVVVLGVSK
jgi:hypothetical protein